MLDPLPRLYVLTREPEGLWRLGYWCLQGLLCLALCAALYSLSGWFMDAFSDYRTALLVNELAERYGDAWIAPSLLPEVAAVTDTPGANGVLITMALGIVIWGVSFVLMARFFQFSVTRHFSFFILLGVALFLISLSIYGGVIELHLAYKIQMVQELAWFDQIQRHTDLLPAEWQYDWVILQSMNEWLSLSQVTQDTLIQTYQLNRDATHYLQRNVWEAWPQQGITWMLQIIPYEDSLWQTTAVTAGEASRSTRPSLIFAIIGLLLVSAAVWLLLKSYQQMRGARLITLLTDSITDIRAAGLQSIEGTVYGLEDGLMRSESISKKTTHNRLVIASVITQKEPTSWRKVSHYHHNAHPVSVIGGQGEAFYLHSLTGAKMGVSLEGAVFIPSRSKFTNASTTRKARIHEGDRLWVLGVSHMDARDPKSTTFESSGRFDDPELSTMLGDVLGIPTTLIVTHYAPDDIKAILSQRGFSWLGGSLICSWLAVFLFVTALMGLNPSSLLVATLASFIAALLVEYFQGATLLRTKANFLQLAKRQIINHAQKRQPLMAALTDCLESKEERLSASEKSAIQEIVRYLKEAVGSSEKALSNAEALADQCHVLHQELSECKATSVVRKRAIQLLFQEAQHVQQQQRALLRSENLLNEQRDKWHWRVISWLIVPSTVPRYRK